MIPWYLHGIPKYLKEYHGTTIIVFKKHDVTKNRVQNDNNMVLTWYLLCFLGNYVPIFGGLPIQNSL